MKARDTTVLRGGGGQDEPSLPASHAFVVQFSGDSNPAEQVFHGRIEHIESGWSQRFASLKELAGFVERALTMAGHDE